MKEVAPTPRDLGELTPRQRAFVRHPLVNSDPVRAAVEAGYSETFAKFRAEILRRELLWAIERQPVAEALKAMATPESVSAELVAAAYANVLDYFDVVDVDNGGSKLVLKSNIKMLPAITQRRIKRIRFDTVIDNEGGVHHNVADIEIHDPRWALESLIKLHKILEGGLRDDDNAALLAHADAKELEELEAIYRRLAEKAGKAANKQKDRNAYPG